MFRFYLDNQLSENPLNWQDTQIVIERDEVIKGLLYGYTTPITFTGFGYEYLKGLFDDGFCNKATALIQIDCDDGYTDLFEGIIFITECEFNLERCTVSAVINDNHYGARIKNNKNIKSFIGVGRSKNDTAITAVPQSTVNMFNPSDGATSGTAREAYSIYNVFTHLVTFASDNEMLFDSNYFGSGGEGEDYVITTGAAIRDTANSHPPYTSFLEAFTEIDKRFNVSFYIDVSTAKPTLWIEPTEDIYNSSEAIELNNVPGLTVRVDESRLYSLVRFGSQTTQSEDAATFQAPDIRFYGHKEEEYHILGECNIDNTLDLVGQWVVDSNVIEDIIVNAVDSYDEEIFIIETDGAGNAVESDVYAVAPAVLPVVYNPSLFNSAIAARYFGGIHNDIASYLDDSDNTFSANKNITQSYNITTTALPSPTTVEPFEFNTEISDTNNNYTAASSYYTAPEDNQYTFRVIARFQDFRFIETASEPEIRELQVTLKIRRYEDNTFANLLVDLEETFIIQDPNNEFTAGQSVELIFTGTHYLNTNETVRAVIEFVETAANNCNIKFDLAGDDTYTVDESCRFETTAIFDGGGLYQRYNPKDFKCLIYAFEYPITYNQFSSLLPNNQQRVNLGIDSGWIKRAEYSVRTGRTIWQVITTN